MEDSPIIDKPWFVNPRLALNMNKYFSYLILYHLQYMEVSQTGGTHGTPKSSKSLNHFSIETFGFGDHPF